MTNATWKHTERAVARALGGERASKHGQGESTPDVLTSAYAVEVKHRKELPAWLKEAMAQSVRNAPEGKLPLVVLHESGCRHGEDLVMMRLADFRDWFGGAPGETAGNAREADAP